ncbi:hypothetical protein CBS147332_3426 [Penicillium roqueforti]|nr:hypothetical protein CBS147332_3426 [Penicillium roqueforti]KAI3117214.1 hypothetical protein CBS147331_3689 [Penicillium roqueforti]KAI3273969.1 hypothetical protein CBS147308_2504 [Penicillium roqueforti]
MDPGFSYHDADLTMWFLAHGANPNQRCGKDRTPLSTAFQVASFEIIQKLLEHGVDVFQGQVLHYAARRRLDDRLQVLDFLLEKGLPINNIMFLYSDDYYANMFDGIGTPLHYAADAGLLDLSNFWLREERQQESEIPQDESLSTGPNSTTTRP